MLFVDDWSKRGFPALAGGFLQSIQSFVLEQQTQTSCQLGGSRYLEV